MKARTFNTINNQNTATQREEVQVTAFSVWGVKAFSNGGNLFNLNVNGITIYGCSVKATRDGEAFVAMPSRKGRDDKWFPVVSCRLPESVSDDIITQVYAELDKQAAGGGQA